MAAARLATKSFSLAAALQQLCRSLAEVRDEMVLDPRRSPCTFNPLEGCVQATRLTKHRQIGVDRDTKVAPMASAIAAPPSLTKGGRGYRAEYYGFPNRSSPDGCLQQCRCYYQLAQPQPHLRSYRPNFAVLGLAGRRDSPGVVYAAASIDSEPNLIRHSSPNRSMAFGSISRVDHASLPNWLLKPTNPSFLHTIEVDTSCTAGQQQKTQRNTDELSSSLPTQGNCFGRNYYHGRREAGWSLGCGDLAYHLRGVS
ncbi:hypothetical protein B0J13DRAFT_73181 [Dactylonectria estremocensis]|uniref:Uncharacterized protein n=1 Tax=Dactylonectria estremocensis TaxID=1079267 RepID=A0A9P9EHF8_9HYPO|nr:hypothetical protein B0J13DRAFT_73181 [Dactylonectria estremocensis]